MGGESMTITDTAICLSVTTEIRDGGKTWI